VNITEATRFEPQPSELTKPYWDATRDRRLLLQWCASCDEPVHYPREVCPRCLGEGLSWREASGAGEVYAFGVHHQPASPLMADRVPYVVALIDLVEGARLMSNIVGCEPAEVRVGMSVKVTWEALSDGRHLPLFEPNEQGES
jgi:uncharacterized OB-fold protein